jgi:hypothetical protein
VSLVLVSESLDDDAAAAGLVGVVGGALRGMRCFELRPPGGGGILKWGEGLQLTLAKFRGRIRKIWWDGRVRWDRDIRKGDTVMISGLRE